VCRLGFGFGLPRPARQHEGGRDQQRNGRQLPPEELAQYFEDGHAFYQRLPVDRRG
jgi:hypothetical protein